MAKLSLQLVLMAVAAAFLAACADSPVEFNADNPGGILHQISTDPSEIFRNKVDHEATLEARGVEPPVGNASWRDYWNKLIAYYTSAEEGRGTHQEIAAYVAQQRRSRGLPPL